MPLESNHTATTPPCLSKSMRSESSWIPFAQDPSFRQAAYRLPEDFAPPIPPSSSLSCSSSSFLLLLPLILLRFSSSILSPSSSSLLFNLLVLLLLLGLHLPQI
eukprot:6248672-Pyramimonas_sp.AAC.1